MEAWGLMGHHIKVFIGPREVFAPVFRAAPFAGTVDLAEGMVATPLTDAVIDGLGGEADAPSRIRAAGERLSAKGPVLYLITDYFGGAGGKEAAGWRDGRLVDAAREGDTVLFDPATRVSDTGFDDVACRTFGWDAGQMVDVSGLLGLGSWRHTDNMAEEVRAPIVQPLGVILAGGQATRMGGGDKGLLQVAGAPILGHVIERLRPQVAKLAINANGDPTRFRDFQLHVLSDSISGFPGPLAGVLAGLDWAAAEGASHIVTAAADTPFFPGDLVVRLQEAAELQDAPIALARTDDGRHPTFGLWPVSLRDDLRAALLDGLRKVVLWTDKHGTAFADFPTVRFDPFFNVNTPEDLAHARQLLGDT